MENLKQEDEGSYKCILNNGGEDVEHEFNIYVTGEYVRDIFPFSISTTYRGQSSLDLSNSFEVHAP